jgi:tetratricopeptide (TPR) repeat protein
MSTRGKRRRYISRHVVDKAQQLQAAINQAAQQVESGQYEQVIRTCEAALPIAVLPAYQYQRAELLNCLGGAYMMCKDFDAAYAAFSEAVQIIPQDPYLWYNRGFASRYTMRSGQALRDFERAVALEGNGDMALRYSQAAHSSRQQVQKHLKLRGGSATLEELITQEELFHQAVSAMDTQEWATAEDLLRQVITLGDGLPQPWSNLGACLVMQQRYAEGEAAYLRALELDPTHENARYQLEQLRQHNQSGGHSDDLAHGQASE